jgi:DNA mismatch endonuclease (patch repair protein)
MSRIRSSDTKPEMLLRSALHRMGFRFRVHKKGLPGRPDIVLPKYHAVIFVHGCFWHQHPGCIEAVRPKTNQEYWTAKLENNVKRDRKNLETLRKGGWKVFRFWECEIEKDPIRISKQIHKKLQGISRGSEEYSVTRLGYKQKR